MGLRSIVAGLAALGAQQHQRGPRAQPDTTAGAGDGGLALQRRTKTGRPPESGPGQIRAVLPQQVGKSKMTPCI